jgi:NAD(P)-dependent dehydrogenase (short-subunit alcohol dehydrogenase family)
VGYAAWPGRNTSMAETAIITGANSGIGRATAMALAGDGFDVGFTHLDDEAGARETMAGAAPTAPST